MTAKCPRCGKEVENAGNSFRPFCSEHCKTIDLGNWISGAYRIPSRNAEDEEKEEGQSRDDSEKE
jgi:uncharacterized protein